MLIEEFEKLTRFFPTAEHYAAIEAAYMEFDGDKAAFCAAYKANKDGIADAIARKANAAHFSSVQKAQADLARCNEEIAELKWSLEREQEWQPYASRENVQQSDYEELLTPSDTKHLSDADAKDLLYNWFGFSPDKTTIYRSVPLYEINRHRRFRKIGALDRSPLYNATDWNYIRFDCGPISYELHNGQIRLFYD